VMTRKLIITGVGAWKSPLPVLVKMSHIGLWIAQNGHTLRTGGARGADQAFANGYFSYRYANPAHCEIYVPWASFESRARPPNAHVYVKDSLYAQNMAARYHPDWGTLKEGGRKRHGRNCHQLLGQDLTIPIPSDVLICWTPDGCSSHCERTRRTGGTGTAISIATEVAKCPVINLNIPKFKHLSVEEIVRYIESLCS